MGIALKIGQWLLLAAAYVLIRQSDAASQAAIVLIWLYMGYKIFSRRNEQNLVPGGPNEDPATHEKRAAGFVIGWLFFSVFVLGIVLAAGVRLAGWLAH